ncbi:MAG TPA: phospho-N-acetylmuramoyl-pentapeptide-transferase [Candidatus Baltobacteraceae bacterium]|nr:phospho-N-acetylmuramoyl-pentapeptide-transferase [Candidatus Baltobacteraceae bacterium]
MNLLIAAVAGFLLAALSEAALLPLLRNLKFRQHAYEDAPQSHQVKTGTPTMGGIVFVIALLPLVAQWSSDRSLFAPMAAIPLAILLLVAACALIGFIDDYSAIRKGKNAGLRARTKYLLTALAAVVFLQYGAAQSPYGDVLFHAGSIVLTVPHAVWVVLGILAVSGTIHAVNLTDGLDGLAAGTMVPPLAALALIASSFGLASYAPAVAALLGAGACIGFLVYNRHPAKVFMGDTGSLALGALLSGVAIAAGEMLLLILIGGVFVAEALSVIIQVTYFKRTGGKRIFKMSPLHHHFELSGWPETTVTQRFWLTSAALSAAGVALVFALGAVHVR